MRKRPAGDGRQVDRRIDEKLVGAAVERLHGLDSDRNWLEPAPLVFVSQKVGGTAVPTRLGDECMAVAGRGRCLSN
jgi:hypothetical protein